MLKCWFCWAASLWMLKRIVQSCSCHFTAHTQTQTHTDKHTPQVISTHKVTEEPESSPPAAAPPSTSCGSTGWFPPKKCLVTRTVREGCDGKFTFRSRSELALASASFLFFFLHLSLFSTQTFVFSCAVSSLPSSGHGRSSSNSIRFSDSLFFKTFSS